MPSVLSNTKYRCLGCMAIEDVEAFPHKCRHCGSGSWEQIMVVRVCDFCSINLDQGEGFSHVCRPFVVMSPGSDTPGWGSGRTDEAADWLACPTCHGFIIRNDRRGLALRSLKRHMELPGGVGGERRSALATILLLHEGFFRSATGEFREEEDSAE